MKHLHFPVQVLTHQGSLIIAAAGNHPEVGARLPDGFVAAADTLCQKVDGDVSLQKIAKGELGNLTAAQQMNLTKLHRCLARAQKTAKLAFSGQTVKLHQEFEIGAHDQNDLAIFLMRCDVVLASVAKNLSAFKAKGWSDGDTQDFTNARAGFGPAEEYRVHQISDAKSKTITKTGDAGTLYDNILTIQNAVDLEWPAEDPANAGVRGEFLLGVFPPDTGGNNHTPPPTPPPVN